MITGYVWIYYYVEEWSHCSQEVNTVWPDLVHNVSTIALWTSSIVTTNLIISKFLNSGLVNDDHLLWVLVLILHYSFKIFICHFDSVDQYIFNVYNKLLLHACKQINHLIIMLSLLFIQELVQVTLNWKVLHQLIIWTLTC